MTGTGVDGAREQIVSTGAQARMPVFFVSYARNHVQANVEGKTPVLRLYDDLSSHIGEFIKIRPGRQPGFVDRGMPSGDRWPGRLAESVGTCQVFVPLVSAPYTESDWCERELTGFRRREVKRIRDRLPDHGTAVLPVLWTPLMDEEDWPETLTDVQRFSVEMQNAELHRRYVEQGLFLLMHTDAKDYQAVVAWLAYRIVQIYSSYHVEPQVEEGVA